ERPQVSKLDRHVSPVPIAHAFYSTDGMGGGGSKAARGCLSPLSPREALVSTHLVPRLRLGTQCPAGSACREGRFSSEPAKIEAEPRRQRVPRRSLGTRIAQNTMCRYQCPGRGEKEFRNVQSARKNGAAERASIPRPL